MTNKEYDDFWEHCRKAATVDSWPDWKKNCLGTFSAKPIVLMDNFKKEDIVKENLVYVATRIEDGKICYAGQDKVAAYSFVIVDGYEVTIWRGIECCGKLEKIRENGFYKVQYKGERTIGRWTKKEEFYYSESNNCPGYWNVTGLMGSLKDTELDEIGEKIDY